MRSPAAATSRGQRRDRSSYLSGAQTQTRRARRVHGAPADTAVTSGNAPTTPAADGSLGRLDGPSPGHAAEVNT